jgi:hypothetical protein
MRHPINYPATLGAFPSPGASTTLVLFDDKTSALGRPAPAPNKSHVRIALQWDQVVTVVWKWAPNQDAPDSALITINGSGSGEVTTANVFYKKTCDLQPGRNQISIVTGATPPSANYVAVEASSFYGTIA